MYLPLRSFFLLPLVAVVFTYKSRRRLLGSFPRGFSRGSPDFFDVGAPQQSPLGPRWGGQIPFSAVRPWKRALAPVPDPLARWARDFGGCRRFCSCGRGV